MSLLAVAAAAAVMAGAALQSAIGFGFALVAAPLVFAAAPSPEQAVGLMIVLGLVVNLLTLLAERRRPAPVWRDVAAVVAWSQPGALAGVALLDALDALALQLLVTAGVLTALAINLRAAHRAPPAGTDARDRSPRVGAGTEPLDRSPQGGAGTDARDPPRWARAAAGLASGALNTSTSIGGPPVALLLMARGLRPAVVRDTLTACFVGFAGVSAAALLLTGTGGALPKVAWVAALVPAAALGHLAGRPAFARLAAGHAYERVLTVVLLVTVAIGLLTVAL